MIPGIDVQIVEHAFDPSELLKNFASSEHGGECSFVGRVRSHNLGREVKGMAYDIHEVLARKSLLIIAEEARERWEKDAHVLVVHRHGYLKLGEPSVLIAASCRHRDEAFRICRHVIDELKHRTPIWKKEYYRDGESQWVQGHALCQHKKSHSSLSLEH